LITILRLTETINVDSLHAKLELREARTGSSFAVRVEMKTNKVLDRHERNIPVFEENMLHVRHGLNKVIDFMKQGDSSPGKKVFP